MALWNRIMIMKNKLLLFVMLLLGKVLYAQNLVPNSSFESYYRLNELPPDLLPEILGSQFHYKKYRPKNVNNCPLYGPLTYFFCKDWTNCNKEPYLDSPDLYNQCSIENGVPLSYYIFVGLEFTDNYVVTSYQNARSGEGYIGIGVLNARIKKIKNINFIGNEFIQSKLLYPLQKNEKYHVEFYVNRANFSTVSTDRMGAYFSTREIKVDQKFQMFKYKPQINNPEGNVIEDTVDWVKVSGVYHAKGGERYIIIGDFYPDKENTIKQNQKKIKDFICYYYIDDVSVTPIEDSLKKTYKVQTIPSKAIDNDSLDLTKEAVGHSIVLRNVYFAFGKSDLMPASFTELDKLFRYMKDNQAARIEISGYTDDVGSDRFNMQLSIARAKSVADYLLQKGIENERVSYKGYGKTKPVSNDKSEEGKALNRRVEFKFLSK
jgi:outer membrane protein OmpA-like peptidoglycan-associated protein